MTQVRDQGFVGPLPLEARRHGLIARIRRALGRECRVGPEVDTAAATAPMILGVSGGADSCALLIAMLAIATNRGYTHLRPRVVFIHHHLRDETDRERDHVRRLAERFGVPFESIDIHPGDLPGNVAANARRLRYAALAAAARRTGAGLVAVGHHADDQFETILMMLCRGGGIAGLAGMRPRRRLDRAEEGRVDLIRPLLHVRRTECEALCAAAEVEWIDDPTNLDPSRARGRLRRDVIPALESLWPGAVRNAAHLAAQARSDESRRSRAARMIDLLFESTCDAARPGEVVEVSSRGAIVRLRRDSLRAAPRDLVESIITSAARRIAVSTKGSQQEQTDAAGEPVRRAHLQRIVNAISAAEVRPREFPIGDGRVVVRITSKIVELSGSEPID